MAARQWRARFPGATTMGWGFADQAASSLSNLALSIAAGRLFGASGLGVVFVAFTVYVVALGMARALVAEPLVVTSAALSSREQGVRDGAAVRAVVAGSVTAAALLAVTGAAIGASGTVGRALLTLAPWLPALLLQDLWRSILFRDGRGMAATCNDVLWVVVMLCALSFPAVRSSGALTFGAWGAGALAGALVGFGQRRGLALRTASARSWWRADVRRLATGFVTHHLLYTAGSQVAALLLPLFIVSSDLGGLRAVQTLFLPMTLILPAMMLPGLPLVRRKLVRSFDAARSTAGRLSAIALVLLGAYLAVVVPLGRPLLRLLFGSGFGRYFDLVPPLAIAQVAIAAAVGATTLVKASGHLRILVGTRVFGAGTSLALVLLLPRFFGVVGAAWALAAGAMLTAGSMCVLTLVRVREPGAAQPPRAIAAAG